MKRDECPRFEALSAMLDGAPSGPEDADIHTHAAQCPVCGTVLARLNGLRADFAALPAPRVGLDLAPLIAGRIRSAERVRTRRPVPTGWRRWRQGLPAALGAAVALGAGAYLGAFLVAGGGAAVRPALEMSAFGTVPPGGLCLGPACRPGGR
jgi:anti-sigma factor RsiW